MSSNFLDVVEVVASEEYREDAQLISVIAKRIIGDYIFENFFHVRSQIEKRIFGAYSFCNQYRKPPIIQLEFVNSHAMRVHVSCP